MTKEVTMPRLSETMPNGKILVWYKKVDDQVKKGEVIAEVETDKANMEIEAVDSGVISEILISEGQEANVGEPIAILNGKKEQAPQKEEKPAPKKAEEKPEKPKEEFKEEKPEPEKIEKEEKPLKRTPQEKPSEVKASLLVRELAEKLNVDLSKIKGTGPEGQIKKSDVFMASEKSGKRAEIDIEDTAPGEHQNLTRIRETIAHRMTYSKQNIPHYYVTNEINADKLVEYYEKVRQKTEGISYNDVFLKAIALVLRQFPKLNASFKHDYIDLKQEINIGMAFATEKGLLVPVIHNCDQKSLEEIHNTTKIIKDRVKNDKLKQEDMSGSTFTVSNLGMHNVKQFTAIINPPQSAGLAIGTIMKVPIVKNNEITIGHTVNITLSADHRVMDGADGALFMKDLKNILENPEEIEQV